MCSFVTHSNPRNNACSGFNTESQMFSNPPVEVEMCVYPGTPRVRRGQEVTLGGGVSERQRAHKKTLG